MTDVLFVDDLTDGIGFRNLRDFIHVDDVVSVNLWMMESAACGIVNAGTGVSRSFNDIAKAVVDWHGKGKLEYIDFSENLQEG